MAVLASGEQPAVFPEGTADKFQRAARRNRATPVRPNTRAACAMPRTISAFQLVSIFSSRPGRTRRSRAASSFALAASSRRAHSAGAMPRCCATAIQRACHAQVPMTIFEIGRPFEAIVRRDDGELLRRQHRFDLIGRPDVELAFLVLRIGVERGVIAALILVAGGCISRMTHARCPWRLSRISGCPVTRHASQYRPQQRPHCRRAFSRNAGSSRIRQRYSGRSRRPTGRRCRPRPFSRASTARPRGRARPPSIAWRRRQNSSSAGCGNLGAWPMPPCASSNACANSRTAPSSGARLRSFPVSWRRQRARERIDQCRVLLHDLPALVAVGRRDLRQQIEEPRHAVARVLGKIGAAEERRAVRRQEHRERPAAARCVSIACAVW